jgi:hypothetical protein
VCKNTQVLEMSAKVFESINDYMSTFLIDMKVDSDIIEEWKGRENNLKELISKIVPTKSKKAKKSKNAPKNPRSAYLLFTRDERDNIKKENPDISQKEIMIELGKKWKWKFVLIYNIYNSLMKLFHLENLYY